MSNSKQIKSCQICKNKKLESILFLGYLPPVNQFNDLSYEAKEQPSYPDELLFCKQCKLVQLSTIVDQEILFPSEYPYTSSTTKILRENFANLGREVRRNFKFKSSDLVMDIGSNDGTFLKNFKNTKSNILGIEPSRNVALLANKRKINTINKFFNFKTANNLKKFKYKTDLICAANAICHIPNLKDLIKGIDILLSKKGIFVFEEPYLGSMYKKTSYDQIYDEHIFMFSITSVKKIFDLFNFELIDVQKQKTHGGSMRYVIARKGEYTIKKIVKSGLDYEKKTKIDSIKGCLNFKKKCEISKKKLRNKILSIKKQNKTIAGYAATSKSTTILNYCGIDNKHIDYICDTTKDKIGKFTPKTHIPIVDINHFQKNWGIRHKSK